jgi:hypothetical protein
MNGEFFQSLEDKAGKIADIGRDFSKDWKMKDELC